MLPLSPQLPSHVDHDHDVDEHRSNFDPADPVTEFVELNGKIDQPAAQSEPFCPAAFVPQPIGFGTADDGISPRHSGKQPEMSVGHFRCRIDEDARVMMRRIQVKSFEQMDRDVMDVAMQQTDATKPRQQNDGSLSRFEQGNRANSRGIAEMEHFCSRSPQ